VSRPFPELLPSLLYHRHNREYTADELAYYLALQGKDLYDFRLDRVYYSDALDAPHEIPTILGQRAGPREQRIARALRRVNPRLRGQLIARAFRTDAAVVEWAQLGAEGFGPVEEDERPSQGFSRRLTFPFRLTEAQAGFTVPLPPGAGPALVSLVAANPDGEAPSLRTDWTLDGASAAVLEIASSPRPVRIHLLVPAAVAARGSVRVGVATPTWRDPYRGRDVGLHVGAQWVLAQRLPGPEAIAAAIARVRAEHRAEESLERWWLPAQSLYLPHATLPATIEVGPGDEDYLGPGWFAREDWGRLGAIRWTGGRAEAYLGHAGRATRACVHAYSGEPRLGPVSGRLVVERVDADGRTTPAGETPFGLPPDTWTELAVPFTAAAGLVRLTVHAEPPRVPRERVPHSGDGRGLGLAVRRLRLAG
jgi:hypothetical protein